MSKVSLEIVVTDPLGIHARPAAALAVAVGKSRARATLRYGAKEANAASVIQLLGLGATRDSLVTAEIEGDEAAIDAVSAALHAHLAPGEPESA
jgi:phosphotransferase system HPr (HPr) family protein